MQEQRCGVPVPRKSKVIRDRMRKIEMELGTLNPEEGYEWPQPEDPDPKADRDVAAS
jgi:hypothetical protein